MLRLTEWCGRYTPWAALDSAQEPGGAAGLWLEITGCAHLFGGEEALARELVARLARFGLSARLGLADTPGAAWALARYGTEAARPIRLAETGTQAEALAPLPVAALRLPAERAELLRRLGLSRIADLTGLPPAAVEPRVGPEVARRLRQAFGRLAEPVSPLTPVPPHLERLAFGEPIGAPEDVARATETLLARLCAGLERAQAGGRRFRLTAYRVDGSLARLPLGTARPVREPAHLKRLFAARLETLDPGFGIEAMSLAAETVEPLTALQMTLTESAARPERPAAGAGGGSAAVQDTELDLGRLVDRLGGRLGFERVHRLAPRESHLPERCVAAGPALPHAGARPGRWPQRPPRPVRLLARPEPIEATVGEGDRAAAAPAQFRWRRLLHRVVRAEGPEHLSPEWWHAAGDTAEDTAGSLTGSLAGVVPGPGAETRDYYRVEDGDGRRYWLFRRGERWFLHGLCA